MPRPEQQIHAPCVGRDRLILRLCAEWLSFYEKSLKDAVLSDVMEQLEKMHEAVAKQKVRALLRHAVGAMTRKNSMNHLLVAAFLDRN